MSRPLLFLLLWRNLISHCRESSVFLFFIIFFYFYCYCFADEFERITIVVVIIIINGERYEATK